VVTPWSTDNQVIDLSDVGRDNHFCVTANNFSGLVMELLHLFTVRYPTDENYETINRPTKIASIYKEVRVSVCM